MGALLGQQGRGVVMLERRPDPRLSAAESGRSINLALSTRGISALERVGLAESVLGLATPLRGRMIHSIKGDLAFQPYGRKGQAIHSISRADLNRILIDGAERTGNVELHFGRRCTAVDLDHGTVTAGDAGAGETPVHFGGTVIGTDGAYSIVRREMQRLERQDFSQAYLSHGYKELYIPAGPDGRHLLDRNALHIWPRGGFMLMAMANVDGSFTGTLYLAHQGREGFSSLSGAAEVRAFFERWFPDAVPLFPNLAEEFASRPVGSLVTIRCRPWHVGGSAVLVGDSAHAVVPFFGQGANAAFEDCLALEQALIEHPRDQETAFSVYEARRAPNTDALADLTIGNFREMRDKVASPLFRLEKKGSALLHALLPRWYLPLYSMITFSTIPYAAARSRAIRQRRAIVAATILLLFALLAAAAFFSVTCCSDPMR
ncbi:MAG: FAD-dependent monooxygenase [Gemmatimonadales bacterium]|nr:FAD-dependent monooxygenase [Gemmatimonadales bacterium]